jgi:hypothetical protein
VRIAEGKKALERERHRWEDNNKMNFGGLGWGGIDWVDLAQNRDQWTVLVNTIMNLRGYKLLGQFLSSCVTDSFSRRTQFL